MGGVVINVEKEPCENIKHRIVRNSYIFKNMKCSVERDVRAIRALEHGGFS